MSWRDETKPFRSKHRVVAWEIAIEGAKLGDTVDLTVGPDKVIAAKVGDYVVPTEGGELEHWKREDFRREFEADAVAPPKAGHKLELDR
jgi:hypothetical protein